MDLPAIDVGPSPSIHAMRSNGVNEEEEEEESLQPSRAGAAVDVSCFMQSVI